MCSRFGIFLNLLFPELPPPRDIISRDKKHCLRPYNLRRHDVEIQYSLLTDTLVLQVIIVPELWHFSPCTDFLCSYVILNTQCHSLYRLVSFIQSKISHSKSTNPCSVFYIGFCSSVESAFTNTPSLGMWKAMFLTLGLLNARKIILLLWPMFGDSLDLTTPLFNETSLSLLIGIHGQRKRWRMKVTSQVLEDEQGITDTIAALVLHTRAHGSRQWHSAMKDFSLGCTWASFQEL